MSKKHVLLLLVGLCFLALNFVGSEKAEKLTQREMPEEYREQFYLRMYPSFPVSSQRDPAKALSEKFYRVAQGLFISDGIHEAKKARVKATIYKPLHPMTDLTASGRSIDTVNASRHRWIAVSRDLQKEGFTFGAKVLVSGTGSHDGIWEVQDVMHSRWKQRIDFLSDADAPDNYWKNVVITKIN